jgi:hypothetical protein
VVEKQEEKDKLLVVLVRLAGTKNRAASSTNQFTQSIDLKIWLPW